MEEKHANYFEAILQLRNPKPDIEEFIESDCHDAGRNRVFISRIQKVPNGFDYYLSSTKYARTLGTKLQNKFGGEMIVSNRLFSRDRQTSKEVYRVNVLFRLHDFKVGDIIKIKGKMIKVTHIDAKIRGFDTESGRKYRFSFGDVD